MNTYTAGPNLYFTSSIKKSDYIKICGLISQELSELPEHDQVAVVPEPITEGGFKFVSGDYGSMTGELDGKIYKTMRHFISSRPECISGYQWPRISYRTVDEWRDSNEYIIPQGYYATTYLKAFNGAPAWTLLELQVIAGVLARFGVEVSKMPSAKSLVR